MKDATAGEALKPCPHCTGKAFVRMNTWANKETKGYRVICADCHTSGPIRVIEAEAVAAWNRRPSPKAEMQGGEMLACLEELHAMVWGECPSLLNEDSGGNARLDLRIRALLSAPKDASRDDVLEEAAKALEKISAHDLAWTAERTLYGNAARTVRALKEKPHG